MRLTLMRKDICGESQEDDTCFVELPDLDGATLSFRDEVAMRVAATAWSKTSRSDKSLCKSVFDFADAMEAERKKRNEDK